MQIVLGAQSAALDQQAQRLHGAVAGLVRRYQFRDRNEICCFGISVSQCYALEALGQAGELTMGALASQMRLSVSTMTRVVDQLVKKRLVRRTIGREDHRVCCVGPTHAGRDLLARISAELVESERAILEGIPAEHRESVIHALEELSCAVDRWRTGTLAPRGDCHAGPVEG